MPAPGARCPECATPLAIHQPDPGLPDRLLGTCPSCRTWSLLDGDGGLVAILPTHGLPSRRRRPRPRLRLRGRERLDEGGLPRGK